MKTIKHRLLGLAFILLIARTVSAAAPIAITLAATGQSNTVATLNGTVNPGGAATTVWFEWGLLPFNNILSPAYNSSLTAPVEVSSGLVDVAVSNQLTGLTPGFVYHGRMVASNEQGVVRGLDVPFGSPALTLNGAATMTNECHAAFNDPVTAIGASLAISAGGFHSLALKSDGTVAAWGDNTNGLTNTPVSLSNVVAVAGGNSHNLVLMSDGMVAAWGDNPYGLTNIPTGLSNVVAIAGEGYHCLALKSNGTVAAWGNLDPTQRAILGGLSNIVAIAGGGYHSLALKKDGKVVACGNNIHGQILVPAGLSNVVAIAAGGFHSLALKNDGTVAAWGFNASGQTTIPVRLSNVVAVAAGAYHNLALKSDGTIVAWGAGTTNSGSSANFGQSIIPVGLSNVVAISAGALHSLVLKSDGTVVAWGAGTTNSGSSPNYGQSIIPAAVSNLTVTVSGTFSTNNYPGSYIRNYAVTNSLGGFATATRTVVVEDTLPPVITLNGSNPLTLPVNTPFLDPGALAQDICGGANSLGTNGTVNSAAPGSYSVTYSATDGAGNSTNHVRTVLVFTPPTLAAPLQQTNGTFQFRFTNTAGVNFSVAASTNLALPLSNWPTLGSVVEAPPGQFQFSDPQATNHPQRYYRVQSP